MLKTLMISETKQTLRERHVHVGDTVKMMTTYQHKPCESIGVNFKYNYTT